MRNVSRLRILKSFHEFSKILTYHRLLYAVPGSLVQWTFAWQNFGHRLETYFDLFGDNFENQKKVVN